MLRLCAFFFLSIYNLCAFGQTLIRLEPTSMQHTLSPMLFGTNLQWEHHADGLLDEKTRQFDTQVLAAARSAGLTGVRFPGGDLSNTYRWKNGIGPPKLRPPGRSYSNSLTPSSFGTDELIRLANISGMKPVITINLSAGAEEAADWVEYMNGSAKTKWGGLRAKYASEAPLTVRYWEIGNELYSPGQPGFSSAGEYAKSVRNIARAMKARDASIKIGANLEASFLYAPWMPKVLPHLASWNETVLKEVGKEIDFVVLHFYAPHDTVWRDAELQSLTLAAPLVFARALTDINQLLFRYARPEIEIGLTEFGTAYGDKLFLSKRIASTEGALFTALTLFAAMRESRMRLANHWSLLNNSQYGMLVSGENKPLSYRPTFDVYRMLASFQGARLIRFSIKNVPTYEVNAKGSVPHLKGVPIIEAVAAKDSAGNIFLAIVNRHASVNVPVTVENSWGDTEILGQPVNGYIVAIESLSSKPGAQNWGTPSGRKSLGRANTVQVEVLANSLALISYSPMRPSEESRK